MITIQLGDITKLTNVDVIVNAAKKSLLGGGGVDGAIHSAAGIELFKECQTLGGCEYGEAKLTKAYQIPIKGIIHTVAPIHYDEEYAKTHNYNQNELLANCYRNCIKLAKENNFNKIAFPALGCGNYCWKYEDSVKIVKQVFEELKDELKDMEIILIFFEEDGYEIYKEYLKGDNYVSI